MKKDFSVKLMEAGIDSLRFFILTNQKGLFSDRKEGWQECYISESRYKLKDNYKMTLVPIDQRYCSNDYYLEDFESLLGKGYIIQKTNPSDYVQKIEWQEPLGNIMVVHNAEVVVNIN